MSTTLYAVMSTRVTYTDDLEDMIYTVERGYPDDVFGNRCGWNESYWVVGWFNAANHQAPFHAYKRFTTAKEAYAHVARMVRQDRTLREETLLFPS